MTVSGRRVMRLVVVSIAAMAFAAGAAPLEAEVVRVEVDSRTDILGGRAFGNAGAGVVLATALRHSLARRRSSGSAALRLAVAPVMLAAAAARSPIFGAVVSMLAAPLLALREVSVP